MPERSAGDRGTGWRIVVGADEAGYSYKELIRHDLELDSRVEEVLDVGSTATVQLRIPRLG